VRADPGDRAQVHPERRRRAETGAFGDPLDRQVGGLQQVPGQVDAPADQPRAGGGRGRRLGPLRQVLLDELGLTAVAPRRT
jgi:hypothetical protein